ncbi:MAG: septal ring lytic transglycosylase RlpA family protein [Ignavibacteria bacterium]|nr:septal ring lytic transglycosylase RlpA family protein [Ignavibacteria bacterium]MCC7158795.1 septal ring lytic transglycosylase RlpA family protein [Ignavibacteria bacterium]
MKGDALLKTRILWLISFLTVQLVLTSAVSENAYSKGDPTGSSFEEIGEASWYGPGFHGRKTANGERFDTYEFTAAHKTLPFGTLLKVTNLENNLTTVVRVNDRGPYIRGRIIDLSKASKEAIGMGGTAQVKIEQITDEEAEMLRQGIDPDEHIDITQIDTNQFKTTELLNDSVDADSKIFVEFMGEDGTNNDFELNKSLKSKGNLKIKVVTPRTEEDNEEVSNLYQQITDLDSLIRFYDLSNQLAVVKGYSIEVGTFTDKSLADRRIGRLERDGFTKIYLEEIVTTDPESKTKTTVYKVLAGLYEKQKTSKKDLSSLTKLKYQPKLVKIGE